VANGGSWRTTSAGWHARSQRRPLAAGQSTAALLAKYLAHRDFVGLKGDSFGGCNNKKYATKEAIFSAVAISTICR